MSVAIKNSKLPLYVLTGFLGSGKTSLLRRCLQSEEFADTAVLINEFGEIGLDHELVEASEEDTVVLKGGCICCTIREDLASTIRHLADLRRTGKIKPFSRLVVETSGLADPVPVLVTLKSDPRITQHLEFKGTIVTVDGVFGDRTLRKHVESVRQVIYANRAVLTKCDLSTEPDITRLQNTITELNSSIDVIVSDLQGIAPNDLFNNLNDDLVATSDLTDAKFVWPTEHDRNSSSSEHSHSERFCSFSWNLITNSTGPLSVSGLLRYYMPMASVFCA